MEQSEIMMQIVEDRQLDCLVYQTTRGRHFLFKNSGVEKCGTHKKIACGLTADIKIGSRNSYEVIKFNGEERFVEWESEELQELPKWMHPINSKIDFFDMDEGEGRNQSLFNYILTLTNNGFSKEESKECIQLINKYVLHSSLSEDELEVILRDEAFPEETFYDGKSSCTIILPFFSKIMKEYVESTVNCTFTKMVNTSRDKESLKGQC